MAYISAIVGVHLISVTQTDVAYVTPEHRQRSRVPPPLMGETLLKIVVEKSGRRNVGIG